MLLVIGPLVGVSFISAVRTYAELSGYGGTAEGVGEAFSPLVGIWAPTFSACELAAAFLLPFVGIRLVSGDRQSGALKLELQHQMPAVARVAAIRPDPETAVTVFYDPADGIACESIAHGERIKLAVAITE